MRILTAITFGFGLLGAVTAANASGCPGNPGALGTSRVLKIDPREYPRIGTMQYPDSLPLEDKEVVLTFDDGPMPPYTTRVLETLAHECVKANYFIVGRMARGYPDLVRRIMTEGHVIGTHSENHPLAFERMPARAVQTEIDQGFASTTAALGAQGTVAPFFRIPGLLRSEPVESYLRSRTMVTWSADIAADDWKHISASEVVNRAISRLDARGKGILLLHDIQPATALAVPHLLRELKRRGYKIVQVVPETAPPLVARATPRQPQVLTAQPSAAQSVAVQAQPAPKPQPVPVTAAPPAAPAPVVTTVIPPVLAARPAPPANIVPPAPVELPPEAAAANAGPAEQAADETDRPLPSSRTMPIPILEAARSAPAAASAANAASAAPDQPALPQVTRPLSPGFKPSHSESPALKVHELQTERHTADPWAMRAEVRPTPDAAKSPWPVTASSLTQAMPR